jgi:hypothetical protein
MEFMLQKLSNLAQRYNKGFIQMARKKNQERPKGVGLKIRTQHQQNKSQKKARKNVHVLS